MYSVLNSQTMILAATMAVSGSLILLSLWHQKNSTFSSIPHSSKQQPLRSCLSSDGKKKEKKKKKRVHFAEDVKDTITKTETFKKERMEAKRMTKSCRGEIKGTQGMPANRIALYNGILRDRNHRLECSY